MMPCLLLGPVWTGPSQRAALNFAYLESVDSAELPDRTVLFTTAVLLSTAGDNRLSRVERGGIDWADETGLFGN